jgi:YggT family protein
MLIQILAFLLDVVTGLVGGACLLRIFMQHQRVPFANPVGRLVFALSDWLVLPLRRILPSVGRWDTASLVGVWLLKLGQVVCLGLLTSGVGDRAAVFWPLLAALGVAQLLVSGLSALLIVQAVLTWVQPHSTLSDVLGRLCLPLLRPVQRWIPPVGGVDLSPLVVLVGLQIAGMLLAALARNVLL